MATPTPSPSEQITTLAAMATSELQQLAQRFAASPGVPMPAGTDPATLGDQAPMYALRAALRAEGDALRQRLAIVDAILDAVD